MLQELQQFNGGGAACRGGEEVPVSIGSAGGEAGLFVVEGDEFEGIGGGVWFVSDEAADNTENLGSAILQLLAGQDVGIAECDGRRVDGESGVGCVGDAEQSAAGGVAWAGGLSGGSDELLLSGCGVNGFSAADHGDVAVAEVCMDAGDGSG